MADKDFTFGKDVITIGDFVARHDIMDVGCEYQIPGCPYTIFVVKPVFLTWVERAVKKAKTIQPYLIFSSRGVLVTTFGEGAKRMRRLLVDPRYIDFNFTRPYFSDDAGNVNCKKLAGGVQGTVYRLQDSNVCCKLSLMDEKKSMSDCITEFSHAGEMSRLASNLGIAPKFFLEARGIMFMELVEGLPLSKIPIDLENPEEDKILVLLDQTLKIMHVNGIQHNDLHLDNVMIREIYVEGIHDPKYKPQLGDLVVIDFGMAEFLNKEAKKEAFHYQDYNGKWTKFLIGKKMNVTKS